jgi:hypothetical protein
MAKLGLQKFSLTGEHNSARTTFSGTIEMHLYYNSERNYFYFNIEDIKKYIPEESAPYSEGKAFGHCETKQDAIAVMELLISSNIKEKRMLRITIGMSADLYKIDNPKAGQRFEDPTIVNPELPQYLQKMIDNTGVYYGKGLTLSFVRIMELELKGKKMYAGCDENWKYDKKDITSHAANLIDWTPAAEQFLLQTQEKLDSLCKLVLEFFNAGEDVNNLLSKMTATTNLLTEGKS